MFKLFYIAELLGNITKSKNSWMNSGLEKEETSECINDFINNCFAEDVREQLKENFKKITAETFAIQ